MCIKQRYTAIYLHHRAFRRRDASPDLRLLHQSLFALAFGDTESAPQAVLHFFSVLPRLFVGRILLLVRVVADESGVGQFPDGFAGLGAVCAAEFEFLALLADGRSDERLRKGSA